MLCTLIVKHGRELSEAEKSVTHHPLFIISVAPNRKQINCAKLDTESNWDTQYLLVSIFP